MQSVREVAYAYDHVGRNVMKDGARYIWDDCNIIAEIDIGSEILDMLSGNGNNVNGDGNSNDGEEANADTQECECL